MLGNRGNSLLVNTVPTSPKRKAPESDGTSHSIDSEHPHTPPPKRQTQCNSTPPLSTPPADPSINTECTPKIQIVRFDTKACYLGRPSNEVVQKMARLASLTADASARTELSSEQKAKLAIHPKVTKLGQRNKTLTERIRRAGCRAIKDAQGTSLFKKKKRAEARLNAAKKRLRLDTIAQARKRHFRKADTITSDAQFSAEKVSYVSARDTPHAKPFTYNIPERAEVVRLVCSPGEGLTDRQRFRRRIEAIEVRTALYYRREA